MVIANRNQAAGEVARVGGACGWGVGGGRSETKIKAQSYQTSYGSLSGSISLRLCLIGEEARCLSRRYPCNEHRRSSWVIWSEPTGEGGIRSLLHTLASLLQRSHTVSIADPPSNVYLADRPVPQTPDPCTLPAHLSPLLAPSFLPSPPSLVS